MNASGKTYAVNLENYSPDLFLPSGNYAELGQDILNGHATFKIEPATQAGAERQVNDLPYLAVGSHLVVVSNRQGMGVYCAVCKDYGSAGQYIKELCNYLVNNLPVDKPIIPIPAGGTVTSFIHRDYLNKTTPINNTLVDRHMFVWDSHRGLWLFSEMGRFDWISVNEGYLRAYTTQGTLNTYKAQATAEQSDD